MLTWGLFISWAGSACNSPMLAEIVPSQQHSIVYSFDRAFEGGVLEISFTNCTK
jgi:hypothetical protein